LRLVKVVAVVGVRHAFPRAVGREQGVERTHRADHATRQRRDVVEAGGVEQGLVVALGQPEPPLGAVRLELEQLARRLLLEPLARVTLVNAGSLGQLGRGQRPLLLERPVQA
jgi:hypothetical protein